jgi:hypothetical protein
MSRIREAAEIVSRNNNREPISRLVQVGQFLAALFAPTKDRKSVLKTARWLDN